LTGRPIYYEAPFMTRDPDATRAAILEAAEEVFVAKGFGNTALSQIASRAGVTKSLIHHHFGSKGGLWREVKMRRFSAYAQGQLRMLEDFPPSPQLLEDSMRYYFGFLKENPQLVRILAWIFLEQDPECAEMDRELMAAAVAKLKQGQEEGRLRRDVDPRFALMVFIGIAHHWFQDSTHFLHSFDTTGLPKDVDSAYMQDAMRIFLEGIRPRD
jgi:TetR/AcrR family transcriptional regulator